MNFRFEWLGRPRLGTAPDELRVQYLRRMRALGFPIPARYRTAAYHTPESAALPPILDWGAVTAQLKLDDFLRDGFVWPRPGGAIIKRPPPSARAQSQL